MYSYNIYNILYITYDTMIWYNDNEERVWRITLKAPSSQYFEKIIHLYLLFKCLMFDATPIFNWGTSVLT